MPSPNAIAPPPSTACFQLSAVNFRLFCSNSFRITYICKNGSLNPYGSHTSETKDLKPFRITYLQKKGVGERGYKSIQHRHPACPELSRRDRARAFGGRRGISPSPRHERFTRVPTPVGTGDSGYFRLSTVDCQLPVTSRF